MGTCFSAPTAAYGIDQHNNITEELRQDKKAHDRLFSVAFIGTKSCGKTTLMNQLDILHTKTIDDTVHQFSNATMKHKCTNDIRQNCIDNIIVLCEMVDDEKSIDSLTQLCIDNDTDFPKISKLISNIWKQHNIKTKYSFRYFYSDDYFLYDNMKYFFDKIDEILDVNYNPTNNDLLFHHSSNTAVSELMISIKDVNFKFIDFKHVSMKNIHMLSSMNGVIFAASLSDYCIQNESFDNNAMMESINEFEFIANSRYGWYTRIILLFNKVDVFRECLKQGISLKYCFGEDWIGKEYGNIKLPMVASYVTRTIEIEIHSICPSVVSELIAEYLRVYTGESDMSDEQYFDECYMEAIKYIEEFYIGKIQNDNRTHGRIHTHVLSAVDSECTRKVFDDVQHSIVLQSLCTDGLI